MVVGGSVGIIVYLSPDFSFFYLFIIFFFCQFKRELEGKSEKNKKK